jgi:hypothetical protein
MAFASRIARALAALVPLAVAAPAAASPGEAAPRPRNAATLFGGWMLDNTWDEIFLSPGALRFENAGLAGAALAREVWAPRRWFSVEIEGQIVRHFGDQDHWEINAPVATGRVAPFAGVDASLAFGLGLSFASETPALEVANESASEAVMVYWMIEAEAGLPPEDWSLVGRIHHRSTGFGLFGDDGGSNALALGLRRRF